MSFAGLKLRWKALFQRRQFVQEVDDEIAFHLAMRREKLREAGLDPSTAEARFGNPTRAAETLRTTRGWGWLERLWQDVRYGLRQLRLNPGFTAGAVLPLGVAIGCAAAILTLTDAVLFRPMGVKDPSKVATVYSFSPSTGRYLSDSYPDFRDVAALTGQVDSVAAYVRTPLNIRLAGGTESMNVELVTEDYFRATGVVPVLGRALSPGDDSAQVAVVSYGVWESRYQGSPSILGSVIRVNGAPFTIVGVMPPGYRGMLLDWGDPPSLWTSLKHFNQFFPTNTAKDYESRREVQMLMMLARLRPGVSVPQFQAALEVLAERFPTSPSRRLLALPSAQARFFPAYRGATIRFLWLLLTVSLAAVAIACFNLANLLMARSAARHHEMSTRVAVGASRSRLLQQLIVEHAVLAGCACVLSVPVAIGVTTWLRTVQFTYIFRPILDLSTDWRALGIGMAAGLITAVLAGVAPAFRAARLKKAHAGRAGLRDLFICGQVACAMAVLVSAAVLADTLHDNGKTRLGYDAQGVLLGSLDVSNAIAAAALLRDVRAQSQGAALAWLALPTTMRANMDVQTRPGAWATLAFNWVSDGYFDVLRIPILEGRAILAADDLHSQPVAVVNHAAAAMLWPGENPVGHRLHLRQEPQDRQVIGVAEDIRVRPLGQPEAPTPYVFLPLFQKASINGVVLHVRTPGLPLQFGGTLRQIFARIAPETAPPIVSTLEEYAATGLEPMRVAAQATAAVSLLGVALALAGIFASAAYRVTQQKKEIAIRIAIGAKPGRVIRGFAARGLCVGAAGACLGLPAALWGVSLLRSAVAGTGVAGPGLLVMAMAGLILAAFAAGFAAAARITRLQPSDILRVQ